MRTPTTRAAATATTSPRRRPKACCARASATIALQTLPYGEAIEHHGVRLSLHPGRPRARLGAGAARARRPGLGRLGRLQRRRRRADAREDNATCAPFEPVRCHCFITESTFGLPIYRWQPQAEVFADDRRLVARAMPRPAAPACCSATASARRSASCAASIASIGPIVVHGAVEPLNRAYRAAGVDLPDDAAGHRGRATRRCSAARPGRRAAVGAGLGLDAPLRRLQRRLRQRLDAAARRAPPALGRPRLRASATTPTGPACSAPSPPPAPSA